MKRALILEDHDSIQILVKEALQVSLNIKDIDIAATIEHADLLIVENHYDIAIIDINLPDGNGLNFVSRLKDRSPETYPVVLTIYDDDHHVFEALKAGAKGYLTKEQAHTDLVQRLKRIPVDEPPLAPSVSRRIITYFNREGKQGKHTLSDREVEVLVLVSRGYQRSEISEMLSITTNTTSGYIKNIYKKLNVSSRSEAALEAVRLGLVS
ncbi:MAG: response regulator transcription factor [Gammaproteobacteria bacterium]|nr:response regulator transcription factor [Gammaproteobacteria bacterium]